MQRQITAQNSCPTNHQRLTAATASKATVTSTFIITGAIDLRARRRLPSSMAGCAFSSPTARLRMRNG